MNEQITEQTNNGEGVQSTGADQGTVTSTAVAPSVATENQGANKATEGGDGATDPAQKEGEGTAQKEGAENKAQKQDNSKNAEMARQRRERERQEELKRARIDGIKSVIKENPYTKKPIEDDSDVEEYLLMQKIAEDGKDPIADYPEYVKKQAREKVNQNARVQATNDKITKDIEEFATAHPTVNINEMFEDEMFMSFAEGKLGIKSLSEIYSSYLPFEEAMTNAKREAEKKAHAQAVAQAAVGSLTNASTPPEGEFFTKEQVLKMSPKEVHDNYEKIRRSQAKW